MELQATLRKEMFGTGFWKRLSKKRRKVHGAEKSVMEILLTHRVEQKENEKQRRHKRLPKMRKSCRGEGRPKKRNCTQKAEDESGQTGQETPTQTALRLAIDELDEARDSHSSMQHEIDPSAPTKRLCATQGV